MTSVVRFLDRGTRILAKAGSYGSINPKRAHPPSRHFSGICQVLCSYDGVLVIKRLPGSGEFCHLKISSYLLSLSPP